MLVVLAACGPSDRGASPSPSASASSSVSASAKPDLGALREAEQRRAATMIGEPDLASRDAEVRRAAARALARIATPATRPLLLRALSDEDGVVVGWAAYGLGFRCLEDREATVAALVARALSLRDADIATAFGPIARAVGRCAATRSEATLVAWLDGPADRAREAALGLGDLAGQTKRLREETLVALLARAEGGVSSPPLPEAVYPLSRLENVPPSVTGRVAQVARGRLADPGPYRLFAIRALGRARESGVEPLDRAILAATPSNLTMPERVEVVRAIARLGTEGQVLLGKVAAKMAEDTAALASLDSAAVLAAALAGLKDPKGPDTGAIDKLAKLAAPAGADARTRRALSAIRCAAAKVVVKRAADPVLLGCDLDKGYVGKRAFAEVLGRSEIVGPAVKMFRDLLADSDVRVREAALELLPGHPEIEGPAAILEAALGAKEPGVASTAAEQIKKNPNLAADRKVAGKKKPAAKGDEKDKSKDKDKDKDKDKPAEKPAAPAELPAPDAGVVKALEALLERAEKDRDLEMLGAVIDAMGALGSKELTKRVEPHCHSAYPAAREHAAAALTLLGGKKVTCDAPDRDPEVAPEALQPEKAIDLIFDTDAGELVISLDPAAAPVTALRVADLARSGYYDGNVIHRVDPSFVVQFGAPFPDGYAGPPGRMPLRCETSPAPFEELGVGLALAGRDTGSSQLFVMRARHPHLDGLYPLIGKASGPWSSVIEGDVIKKVKVVEK